MIVTCPCKLTKTTSGPRILIISLSVLEGSGNKKCFFQQTVNPEMLSIGSTCTSETLAFDVSAMSK
jgi:hypothetical protein